MLPSLSGLLLASLLPLVSGAAQSLSNIPQLVHLRVEGVDSTLFEGQVWSKGHNVTTPSAGTYHCDGLNYNANVKPGATATSVLDDAARKHGFTWDATLWEKYDDLLITTIDGLAQDEASYKYWGVFVNNKLTDVGGCQARVNFTDSVLWLYDAFSATSLLKLENTQPNQSYRAKRGQGVTFVVTDALSGLPVEGAVLNGKEKTNEKGEATIAFDKAGPQKVKAEKEGSVRSNGVMLEVF